MIFFFYFGCFGYLFSGCLLALFLKAKRNVQIILSFTFCSCLTKKSSKYFL